MKKIILFLMLFISLFVFLSEKSKATLKEEDIKKGYDEMWGKVNKNLDNGKPKSAISDIEKIYEKAKKEKNNAQYIKAVIYQMRYLYEVEEDELLKMHNKLKEEIEKAEFPVKNILNSMLGEVYWNFYRNNFFKSTNSDFQSEQSDDIRLWTKRQIIDNIAKRYELSLEKHNELMKIDIKEYKDILNNTNDLSYKLRPNLYDFLVNRAIDFYSDNKSDLTKPVYEFYINNEDYFAPVEKFIEYKIETRDKDSFNYKAVTLIQDALKNKIKDNNEESLFDLDMKRLKFVYNKSTIEEKEIFYEKSLKNMLNYYKNDEAKAEIYYELAKYYYSIGEKWSIGGNEEYRLYKVKALEICENIEKDYPKTRAYRSALSLKNSSILKKNAIIKTENIVEPNKKSKVLLNYKNLEDIELMIVKIEGNSIEFIKSINYYVDNNYDKLMKQPFKTKKIKLPKTDDYQEHSIELDIDELNEGNYAIIVTDRDKIKQNPYFVTVNYFSVSDTAYIERNNEIGSKEIHLLKRSSGEPLKNVEVQAWYEEYDQKLRKYVYRKDKIIYSDENGYLKINYGEVKSSYLILEIKTENNSIYLFNNYLSRNNIVNYKNRNTFLFTDRAIYRPGQTVYFKGICFNSNSREPEKNNLLKKNNINIGFYDVNGSLIEQKYFVTNDYGTFNGYFSIPKNLINGRMRITDGYGDVYISVEEYKRPKFEVTIEKPNKEYKLEDKITVKGTAKSYSGDPIDGATVKYRVERTVYYPYRRYWWWYNYQEPKGSTEIYNGITDTNEKGEFDIEFKALPDYSIAKNTKPVFSYKIYADVTDINGETINGENSINVAYDSLNISIGIEKEIEKSIKNTKINVNTTTYNDIFVGVKGKIEIYDLKENKKAYRSRNWATPDKFIMNKEKYEDYFPKDAYIDEDKIYNLEIDKKVFEKNVDTNILKTIEIPKIDKWKSGVYRIDYIVYDKDEKEIKISEYFTVFSKDDKKVPDNSVFWKKIPKQAKTGEEVEVLIGSFEENIWGIYEVEHRGKIIEKKYIKLNKEIKKIPLLIKEEYRGNVAVRYVFIKDNRVYMMSENIIIPWSDKKLNIEFETFRSKISPSEKEEWKIKITDENGKNESAEMAAVLYDASLDSMIKHNWQREGFYGSFYKYMDWGYYTAFGTNVSRLYGYTGSYSYMDKSYSSLNWFGIQFYPNYYGRRSGMVKSSMARSLDGRVMMSEAAMPSMAMDEMAQSKKKMEDSEGGLGNVEEKEVEKGKAEIKIRQNFNETAFFYPELRTNEKGEVYVSFTMPDTLTRWRMLGFANTADLKYGFIENELVTAKEFAITTNNPRFLREDDTIYYPISIRNNSEKEIKGDVELLIFDGYNMKDVTKDIISNNNIKFDIDSNKSKPFSWQIKVPRKYDMLVFRVIAKAGKYSDGEENIIPVLKNRMMVTESIPLAVRENENKKFEFKKLIESNKSETLDNYKLTFEFTSNPAWTVVQALPYLMEYPYECMEQTFSRYYANRIALNILNANPEIERIYNIWKNTPDSPALISNLEKNQELKAVLLEQTPWVMDGKNETERKKRIAMLFDRNKVENELDRALKKLEEGQLPSGGWPWFKGMKENRYITQYIITGFAKLENNNYTNDRIYRIAKKAIEYLDEVMLEDYKMLKKYNKKMEEVRPSTITLNYLYARSFYQEGFANKNQIEAFNYFKKQSKKYWNEYNYYTKAMMSIYFERYDDKDTAVKILESVKEYALYSEEMGMYWKMDKGFYWNELPIETQSMLILAFDKVLNDKESVHQMKVWLLKNKQVNNWESTKATVEACNAFLNTGDNWLKENNNPDIKIGNDVINFNSEEIKQEAGTGYIKMSWNEEKISSEQGKIEIKNNNKVPAWGAMYWQYYENLENITEHSTNLKIVKTIYVERSSDTGPIYVPIDKEDINTGDRLKIRIDIETDRDMEYVHLRDMRASGLEPENVLSGYKWRNGLGYYETTKDASTDFFFDYMPKGKHVFEYTLKAYHKGDFSNGIATIQCMYAPEFTSHSAGSKIIIK